MACSAYPVHPNGPRGRIDRGTCKEDLADASIRWHRGGGGGHRRVWRDGGRAEPEPVANTYRVTDAIPIPVPVSVSDTREHVQGRAQGLAREPNDPRRRSDLRRHRAAHI